MHQNNLIFDRVGVNFELHDLVGKPKNIHVIGIITFQNGKFCNGEIMKGPNLQDPYLRVTDIQFLLVCSRWCTSLLCQGAREKKKKPKN